MTVPKAFGGSYASLLKRGAVGGRTPPHVVTLPLSAWDDAREDKPAAPIPIGLKLPSEIDCESCQGEAEKAAERFAPAGDYDDKVTAYNDAIIRELIARCSTLAGDVTQPFFEMGALDVGSRLTRDGVQRMWQELEVLREASNASMPEIDAVEGFAHLVAMWDREAAWAYLPPEEKKKCFRLLEFVRQSLAEGEERAERMGEPPILTSSRG